MKHEFPAPYVPHYSCSEKDLGLENPANRELILQYEVILREPEVQSN